MTANTQATAQAQAKPHISTKPIAMEKVESSQIAKRGYDPETQTLAIQFKGKKEGEEGSVYHYGGFSQEDWDNWGKAESVGSHFYRHIKPHFAKFPYVKIS